MKTAATPDHKVPEFVCSSCGDFVSKLDETTGWCEDCSPVVTEPKLERYLRQHADELEHYLLQGYTLFQAVDRIQTNGTDICIVCGGLIKRGRKPRIFCRGSKECKRMSRRYVYLYTERGYSKAEALAQIISDLS